MTDEEADRQGAVNGRVHGPCKILCQCSSDEGFPFRMTAPMLFTWQDRVCIPFFWVSVPKVPQVFGLSVTAMIWNPWGKFQKLQMPPDS